MSIQQHTPEPWKTVWRGDEECRDIDAKGSDDWRGDVTVLMNVGKTNARRIVACVNACAGIPTDVLEEPDTEGQDLARKAWSKFDSVLSANELLRNQRDELNQLCEFNQRTMDELLKQRDELLAALEQFATWGRMQHKAQSKGCHATFDMMSLKDEIDLAEAAITSVKGGAA